MNAVTKADLAVAATIDDLDDAVRSVQDKAGITDGDIAGLFFGAEDHEAWPGMSVEQRLARIEEWFEAECLEEGARE